MVGRHARAFRYSGENFALVFAGKGRNEVLGDLEDLRADIEDFRFAMRPKAAENGKREGAKYPSVRWSLTVTVGVAEVEEKVGGGSPGTELSIGPLVARFTVVKRLAETQFRNRTAGPLLLPFCGRVILACYVGTPGAPHGSQHVQPPKLGKSRW